MRGLVAFNLWRWIDENRASFEPPVGNKVIWEDSQFTAMIVRGPNGRRDFHVDPSDEIFYMLRGAMRLEFMVDGRRNDQIIREGELCLLPALVPHSPHRPADARGRHRAGAEGGHRALRRQPRAAHVRRLRTCPRGSGAARRSGRVETANPDAISQEQTTG